ncbi:MAG: ABC transporter ATP-binding protein [Anaerolineae bacterium]|nr:ABC transporter ATP-binding protein/permease [Candidatus Roseilinea sp.]MDW8451168.1 ABC transporter ATP-binding protein [Anaerolineae bacterium]
MRDSLRLARFLKPYWVWATLAPLLMVLEVAMDLTQPRLIEHIVDEGIAKSDLGVVVTTGLLQVVAALAGLGFGVGCAVFAIRAGQAFGADVRSALFRKVQSLSFGNLDRLETGGLIIRLTNDVTQVTELVMMLLRVMVRVPMLMIGGLILAVITSPQLSLVFVVLFPVVILALVVIINRTFPLFGEVQRRLDALNTVMQENLAGVRVVKAFARREYERERFGRTNDALMERNIAAVRIGAVTMPLMMLLLNAGVIAALWFGGVRVRAGDLQVGQLIAFINYLTMSLMALIQASMLVVRVARAAASSERINEVLDSVPEVADVPDALTTFAPRGRLALEEVSFSYAKDGRDAVLEGVSFTVEPGQTLAVLGATGAGKTSLVSLIPRFYDVTGGRVTLDGVDVRRVNQATLRRSVAVALQESVLFSGTIRDNIRYGRPDASDDEVIAAAKMAQAHEFISRLPDGYDAVVGQRGVNLSGGQKQRIAIARALLMKPAVLVLDDSTSAVDTATEARIQAALDAWPIAPTRVVVAQRISSVVSADHILVLDNGRVMAQGTHDQLLANSAIYREIYQSQMGNGVQAHA